MTDQAAQPFFSIEKIYVKDLSLELPNAPQIFLEQQAPQVEVQLANAATQMTQPNLFEVVLTVTVTAKAGEKTFFLAEAAQSGIFTIRDVPEQDLDPILQIACPNILFPYAREAVADLITRGGFPPVHLAPVNFEALYAQRTQQQQPGNGAGPRIEIAH
jgi:preprotein translocase subunit SecB